LNERIGKVVDPGLRAELALMIVDIESKGTNWPPPGPQGIRGLQTLRQAVHAKGRQPFLSDGRAPRPEKRREVRDLFDDAKVDEAMETLANFSWPDSRIP